MAHFMEQVGDYVMELLDPRDHWHVRMAGDDQIISVHNSKKEAKVAIKQYQANDKRRAA